MKFTRLAIDILQPPAHPLRAYIDETQLCELAEDIARNGVKVPLQVKSTAKGYEVVDGHRRLLAARRARVETVPVLILGASDGPAELIGLSANLYRQEMTAPEEGAFFAELIERCGQDLDAVCSRVGKKRTYVESRLALLAGDAAVLESLAQGTIKFSVAAELNKIHDEGWRHYYLSWAITQGATAAMVQFWRQTANGQGALGETPDAAPAPPAPAPPTPDEVFTCPLCKSSERKFEMGVAMMHHDCRAGLEIALQTAAEREVMAAHEPAP
jgi:ParB/RepB/Spo0J family partition protein